VEKIAAYDDTFGKDSEACQFARFADPVFRIEP
jgi:hypothetical protein